MGSNTSDGQKVFLSITREIKQSKIEGLKRQYAAPLNLLPSYLLCYVSCSASWQSFRGRGFASHFCHHVRLWRTRALVAKYFNAFQTVNMKWPLRQIYMIYKTGFHSIDFSADCRLVWNTDLFIFNEIQTRIIRVEGEHVDHNLKVVLKNWWALGRYLVTERY